jgi:hypothetical protein
MRYKCKLKFDAARSVHDFNAAMIPARSRGELGFSVFRTTLLGEGSGDFAFQAKD